MSNEQKQDNISTERRDLLVGAGTLGAGALASTMLAGNAFAGDHSHMDHAAHTGSKHAKMIAALHECMRTGDACINHCLMEFKTGDTAMADCARKVLETSAFCAAHAKLVALDSSHMKDLCELSIKMCGDCEKECRKHEKKHSSCKACADACAACIKECKAFLKA